MKRVMEEGLEKNMKEIYLERCPRTLMSFTVLRAAQYFSVLLIFLRVYIFPTIGQVTAMIVAIFSTFVTMSESEIKNQITDPGAIVTVSVAFKILNACLSIMVFTYNGNVNDYFIGLFFVFTCSLGKNYVKQSGFRISGHSFLTGRPECDIDFTNLNNQQLCEYFDHLVVVIDSDLIKFIRDNGLRSLQGMSILYFILLVILIKYI